MDTSTIIWIVVAVVVTYRPDLPATAAPGIMAISAAMMRHMDAIPMHLMPLRMMRVAAVLYCSIADYHRLDLYYVENWSLAADLTILWKTFGAVINSRGAY